MHTFTSKHGWGKIIPDFYEIRNNMWDVWIFTFGKNGRSFEFLICVFLEGSGMEMHRFDVQVCV